MTNPRNPTNPRDTSAKAPDITADELRSTARALERLPWGEAGLTRDQVRRAYRELPRAIYLRLPASKRYTFAREVLHDAGFAQSRAEGEFLGAHPDIPEAESLGDGGPPAWGPPPLFSVGGVEDGGSAEDRAVLEEDE